MNGARIATVLKRDWRLFWPVAAIVGVWQILQRALAEPDPMGALNLSVLLSTAAREPVRYLPLAAAAVTVLAIATLIVVVVQEDDIPGLRGDWLTRPVKRSETLAAKAIFVAGAVLIPGFMAGVVYALVQDVPLDVALLHAFGRTVGDSIGLVLPLFLLASMSSNIAEAAILALLAAGANYMLSPNARFSSGIGAPMDAAWVTDILRLAVILAVALPLAVWQYRRPNRWIVRGLAAVGVAAWIALAYIPRADLARINVAFSPDPASGAAITLPMDAPIDPMILARVGPCRPGSPCAARFALPGATGVPEGSRVILNASRVNVFDREERLVGAFDILNGGPPLSFSVASPVSSEAQRNRARAANEGVLSGQYMMEGDLTLTLLEPGKRVTLPIDGRPHFFRDLGSCRASSSEESPGYVDIRCRAIGTAPNQMAVFVEGARQPRRCALDTSPLCSLLAAPLWARLVVQQRPITSYVDRPGGGEPPETLDIQPYVARAHVVRQVPLKALPPVARGAAPPGPAAPGQPLTPGVQPPTPRLPIPRGGQ